MFSTNQIIRGGLENSSLARRSCCRILLAASFLALLSVSGSVKARDQTPFKASFAGSDFATFPDDCTVSVRHIDEGEATHLGRCTYTSTTIADDCVGGLPGHDDDVTLTAANGDQLFGISPESTTQVDDSDPAGSSLWAKVSSSLSAARAGLSTARARS